jgi:hypothetical protein
LSLRPVPTLQLDKDRFQRRNMSCVFTLCELEQGDLVCNDGIRHRNIGPRR